MAETNTKIIQQEPDEQFDLAHQGGVALYGDCQQPALQHEHVGRVMHETTKPLVHMICWEEEATCAVELSGRVTLAGDKEAPVEVNVHHRFVDDHRQTLAVEPFDHTMHVATKLAEPLHHALQMRTPLEVRFCNPWQVESDYTVDVTMGEINLLSVRLQGATKATPQPCTDERPTPVKRVYPTTP